MDRWAQRLHLTPFLDTRLAELSKGSAQKVGLAQALLVLPDLLVLDEPWYLVLCWRLCSGSEALRRRG